MAALRREAVGEATRGEAVMDDEEIRQLAADLGISEDAVRKLLAAVEAEANPPPGMIVTV
jgi:hypothetical protein